MLDQTTYPMIIMYSYPQLPATSVCTTLPWFGGDHRLKVKCNNW